MGISDKSPFKCSHTIFSYFDPELTLGYGYLSSVGVHIKNAC